MARDIFGLLNGVRSVATAFFSEVGVELQALIQSVRVVGPLTENRPQHYPNLPDSDVFCVSPKKSELAKEFDELKQLQADLPFQPTRPHPHTPPTPQHDPPTPPLSLPTRKYHTTPHLHHMTSTYRAVQSRPCHIINIHQTRHFHSSTRRLCEAVTGSQSTNRRRRSKQKIHHRAQERAVPASRLSRLVSFGGLAAGLGLGTATEVAKRAVGLSEEGGASVSSAFLSEANVERIVSTLCRVRGAALKIGQIISLQDGSLVPEPVQEMFERVRNNADFMPLWQLERVLVEELGGDWKNKVAEFDPQPLAAASIGQVHRALLHDGREVAIKIQYPGVAQSINSDIDNLVGVLKVWNILPEGLFIDHMIEVARRELAWEVDYQREAQCGMRFRELLSDDPRFGVPAVVPELSTARVLTAELIQGLPLDQCQALSQDVKNDICERIMALCLRELFEFQFMQTDPNWSNFYYNKTNNKVFLLDFGASRDYSKQFTDDYIKVIHAAVVGDKERVLEYSKVLGFITGYESKAHLAAHLDSVMILGEAFAKDQVFDFGSQDTTSRIQKLLPALLEDRLTPPPEEAYSLHRKMAGSFLLCAKLKAEINCYNTFRQAWDNYQF